MLLKTRNINKSFPGVKALTDVSISIHPGEIHSIIGENGAGKSTLMNVLMGIYQPDSGEIFFENKEITVSSPFYAQKMGIGIVPQELNLVPDMSVSENIVLGMFPLKKGLLPVVDKVKQNQISREAIAKLNPNIDIHSKANKLSVANQQLVQIARVLAFGAKLIILDEPTASLTEKESQQLFRAIQDLKKDNVAIFYISHRLEEIMMLSDSISVMRDGCLIETIKPSETTIKQLVNSMVGREIKSEQKQRAHSKEDRPVILEVKGLTRKDEFKNINFVLHEGEILGISGLVGSGRTELANAIFGKTSPDEGEIVLRGEKVVHKHPYDAINNHMAYVPEERRQMGIIPLLDVAKNMSLSHLSHYFIHGRIKDKEINRDVYKYINTLGIKLSSINQKIRNLSGGNQQKVIIARCLLAQSNIIILDEPTRGIDVQAKQEIHDLLSEITKTGVSIIVISSELEEILNISDRIMVMHEGLKKGEILTSEANQEKIMQIALTNKED